jgi:ribokinase
MNEKDIGHKNEYVLIIGSSNMDLNIYSKRLPKPGETVTGGMFRQCLGGKGANQAVASARDGSPTIFMGKIGQDNFGDQMLQNFQKEGIDATPVIRAPEAHSGVAFIMIDKKGENMISVAPGANFLLNPKEIRKNSDIIQHATSLIVQMEIPIETIQEIYKVASEGDCIKILNPAPLKPIPEDLFKNIDIIVPNEGELTRLHALLGFKDYSEDKENSNNNITAMSKDIAEVGVRYIITTLGSKGCMIFDGLDDKELKVPAFPVEAVDTVGAGDCFNGVLASQLCKGKTIKRAVLFATCAASIAATRKGPQTSMPTHQEIIARVKEYNRLNLLNES